MTLPDSGWVERLGNAPTIALFGLFVGTGAVWAEGESWGLIDSTSPRWLKPALAVACICSGAMLGWKLVKNVWQLVDAWHKVRLRKRFEGLSNIQQRILFNFHKRGTRYFEMPVEVAERRWFEELEQWGYIECESFGMPGVPGTYQVTEKGWREIERKQRMSAKKPDR